MTKATTVKATTTTKARQQQEEEAGLRRLAEWLGYRLLRAEHDAATHAVATDDYLLIDNRTHAVAMDGRVDVTLDEIRRFFDDPH